MFFKDGAQHGAANFSWEKDPGEISLEGWLELFFPKVYSFGETMNKISSFLGPFRTVICLIFLILLEGIFSSSPWCASYDFLRQVTRGSYPFAHCVLAREEEHIEVSENGTSLDTDEVFITVLDEKGKRRQQVQHFYLNKNYSKLEVRKMEVIKPGGRTIQVDLKKNSSLTDPASASRMNIYDPNRKVMNVFVPGLAPGDTIHYIVVVNSFKPMIKGHFFGRGVLQQTFPARSIRLSITLPSHKPLHHMLKARCKGARVGFKKQTSGQRTSYCWTFEDIPELVPEPFMPGAGQVAMRLLFSTLSSWKDVSKWYYNLVEPKLKVNREIRAEVRKLIEGKKSERERLDALFFFVARKIRYLGIIEEANRPGFEPHDVSLTFSRRYGVCRDKAALLVAMLREAGFQAAPVIMSAGSKLDPEIAVPYFNHAIAAVMDPSGRPKVYMDPTSETSRQFLPDYEQDSSCLPAVPQGSELLLTPVKPPGSNLFVMEITETLDSSGLKGVVKTKTRGFSDTVFRSILMRKSRQEQEKFLRVFLLKKQPGLKINEISWTDPGDNSRNFSFGCRFEIPGAFKKTGVFYPFSSTGSPGLMDSFVFKRASVIRRMYPLKTGYSFETLIKENIRLKLPFCRIYLPETVDIDDAYLKFKRSYSVLKDGIALEQRLVVKKLEIPPDEYEKILQVQAILGASRLNSIVFAPCGQE